MDLVDVLTTEYAHCREVRFAVTPLDPIVINGGSKDRLVDAFRELLHINSGQVVG